MNVMRVRLDSEGASPEEMTDEFRAIASALGNGLATGNLTLSNVVFEQRETPKGRKGLWFKGRAYIACAIDGSNALLNQRVDRVIERSAVPRPSRP